MIFNLSKIFKANYNTLWFNKCWKYGDIIYLPFVGLESDKIE